LVFSTACATHRGGESKIEDVPLVALVVAPVQYDEAMVRVRAWGVFKYEVAWLLLSESDFTYLIADNGVRIEGEDEIFRGVPFPYHGMVLVEGKFLAGDSISGFRGRIEATKVVTLEPAVRADQLRSK
jgi:hypothetical protein